MKLEFKPGERADAGTRRLAIELIEDAILQAEDRRIDPAAAIHEARKDMKKLRGLLRLVRPVAPELYKAENRAFRDAAGALSALRDADAALETFDRVVSEAQSQGVLRLAIDDRQDQEETGQRAGAAPTEHSDLKDETLAQLRAPLEDYRAAAREHFGDPRAKLEDFRVTLLDARERVPDWRLEPATNSDSAFESLGPGLRKTYRRGRKAMAKARVEPSVEAFHDWRKRVKYLSYHLRLLRPSWPKLLKVQRNEVKRLADLLGDDHDLAVLSQLLSTLYYGDTSARTLDHGAKQALLGEIGRQSDRLRRRAFSAGQVVYAERPTAIGRRLGAYWRQAEINAAEQQNAD